VHLVSRGGKGFGEVDGRTLHAAELKASDDDGYAFLSAQTDAPKEKVQA
jgi:hypothetical protein